MSERLFPVERHESMRGHFAAELYEQMAKNDKVWLLTADLGYKVFDYHFRDFPERTINVGAAEQSLIGVATGLALQDRIPFVYSITPFLLFRPAESIRLYLDHERIPVKLIGSGRNDDYKHDGFSHFAGDDKRLLQVFSNIQTCWPNNKEQISDVVEWAVNNNEPTYINLSR